MTTQTEALKLALDKKADNARELGLDYEPENTLHWHALNYRTAPTQNAQAMFEALEKFVAQPEEEKLHPVHIGVDVTKEGTAVTAFYRKPDAVMEMFYSQFHPMAQPEQEPAAFEKTVCPFCTSEWVTAKQHDRNVDAVERTPLPNKDIANIFKAQRMVYNTDGVPFARAIEAAHGIKEKNT